MFDMHFQIFEVQNEFFLYQKTNFKYENMKIWILIYKKMNFEY